MSLSIHRQVTINRRGNTMKGSRLYSGMVAVILLLVVGIAIYNSGGFQMLVVDSVLIGVAGLIVVFILVTAGLIILARGQGCSARAKWHKRLISDRVNRVSRTFYLLLARSSCKSCPLTSLCLGS
jgi:hypothetical protein